MTLHLNPRDLSAISVFGEAALAEAADLTDAMLRFARAGAAGDSAGQLGQLLAGLTGPGDASDRSEQLKAKALIDGSHRLIEQLRLVQGRIGPLDTSMQAQLFELGRARDEVERAESEDTLSVLACINLIDHRIAQLQAGRGGLARCRAIVAQLISAEREAEDQLALVRDVTAPLVYRSADLATLSREADQSRPLARMVDQSCDAMIRHDLGSLQRQQASPARPKRLVVLATSILNAMARSA